MKNLTGKVVVITGAANGIGKALTQSFLRRGATVWGLDLNKAGLTALEKEAEKYSEPIQTLRADVSQYEDMKSALAEITQRTPALHFWINNAGISGLGDFMEKSLADFDHTLKINLNGAVIGTRLALEHMERLGQGTIVNVASVAGHISAPYLTAYSASKHAVVGFTRALRQEMKLKDSPIKLLLVSPGFVDTQMIERGTQAGFPNWLSSLLSTPENVADEMLNGILLNREEIFPTLNGKALLKMYRLFPNLTSRSSRLLLAKSLKDLVLLRKTPPGSPGSF
ncbi:MAG: SDR family oxidoreductase [Deltaproteobacteria bacterium]|nr:SDR family oxidoreductase [Deltaproteobacteria bacterium]MBM4316243.1 SDR family oxidoreductase [Deltaproteobacteria bacterium]